MCSHYEAIKERERYLRHFGVEPPDESGKLDLWPGYMGTFIRGHPNADVGDEAVPPTEAMSGMFGLVPHWATDTKIARQTYNSRSETASAKPSFREAWKRGQHCIIPAQAFYEPDWRSGKAVTTRIERTDGEPMGIAGLWSWWKASNGDVLHSYTMLTINAAEHALMQQFHKPADEKRMVVVLQPESYQSWLEAQPEHAMAYMQPLAAELLVAVATPPTSKAEPV
jgi:putative SOS response-associated peptidase YedK